VFFPLSFSLIRGAKKAGFAPATAILGKPKELPKERGAVSPLAFGEERAEKKTSFAQVFFASCALTSKGALRPRRHSGRKADHYISRHQSRREASYLSLIHLPGQGRERKWAADGGRGRFEDLTRRSELLYRVAFPLAA